MNGALELQLADNSWEGCSNICRDGVISYLFLPSRTISNITCSLARPLRGEIGKERHPLGNVSKSAFQSVRYSV